MKRPSNPSPAASKAARLPSPRVRFGPGFLARIERLRVRLGSASERREGAGAARLFGVGEEFVGYRPYRPGEDPRHVDWNLYARFDQPYVRVSRREASEHWAVLVDTSASMGVGRPGKLQLAAEVAVSLAAIGERRGAAVAVGLAERRLVVRQRRDLLALMAAFEAQAAGGSRGLEALAEQATWRSAGRLFLVGDFLGVEPALFGGLRRPGRELAAVRILAPEELRPAARGGIEWVDPESGERTRVHLDASLRARYERALEEDEARWESFASRHRLAWVPVESTAPFESVVRAVLSA